MVEPASALRRSRRVVGRRVTAGAGGGSARSVGCRIVSKPVVLIAEQLSPATVAALGPDFDVREVDGTDRPALLAALADADALPGRSATQGDAGGGAAAARV